MRSSEDLNLLIALLMILLGCKTVLGQYSNNDHHFGNYDHPHDECKTDKCNELPRAPLPQIHNVNMQPQVHAVYTLRKEFDCAVFSYFKPSDGCHTGKSHITPINSTKLTTISFTYCPDNQPCATAIDSDTGVNRTWYMWGYEYTETSYWTCAYSCEDDGEKFHDFICHASDDINIKKIKKIVKQARCICNGRHIHDARQGCPEVNECPNY